MGAATAIMHGERDPSIAAMVRRKTFTQICGFRTFYIVWTMPMPFHACKVHDMYGEQSALFLILMAPHVVWYDGVWQVLDSSFADLQQLADEMVEKVRHHTTRLMQDLAR
jgi:hypothetical protein